MWKLAKKFIPKEMKSKIWDREMKNYFDPKSTGGITDFM